MNPIILQPTATAQWYELINEAEQVAHIELGEELQSYLVFLLMRYTGETELASHIFALDYLNSFNEIGKVREKHLSEMGDKCLLFAGLFPGRAEKRLVRISYYIDMGMTAYRALAESIVGVNAKIYEKLAQKFVKLSDVLQATRDVNGQTPHLEPLQAIELWNDTNSQYALKTLAYYTDATPVKTGYQIETRYKLRRNHHFN